MKKTHVGFDLTILESEAELTDVEAMLMQKARAAQKDAYAPYSNFQVGAAVLLKNGVVVIGNNQENASYPSGLCAERVAVFQAGAQYPKIPITCIAICAASENYEVRSPAAPCGNCRQAMAEYEQKQRKPISILFQGESGPIFKCHAVTDILPLAFNSSFLSDS